MGKVYPYRRQRKRIETRFKNLKGHGSYFVSMNCNKRKPVLSRIIKQKIELSEIGKMVEEIWVGLPKYYPQIKMGEYILMPDHFHGIIHIRELQETPKISLAQVIHSFKTKSTLDYHKYLHAKNVRSYDRIWQRGYNEKWIPKGPALSKIEKYIRSNPMK